MHSHIFVAPALTPAAAEKGTSKKSRKKAQQQQHQMQQQHQQQFAPFSSFEAPEPEPARALAATAPVFTPSTPMSQPPPAAHAFPPLPNRAASPAPVAVLASVDDFFTDDAAFADPSQVLIDPAARPGPSYSLVAQAGVVPAAAEEGDAVASSAGEPLCPFFYDSGTCPYETCPFVHGEQCAACMCFCITPLSRADHEAECFAGIDANAHLDRLREESRDQECGICFDNVAHKTDHRHVPPPRRRHAHTGRFGILSHCSHVFCLACIRNWRHQGSQALHTTKKCPLCQVESHFIIPSTCAPRFVQTRVTPPAACGCLPGPTSRR